MRSFDVTIMFQLHLAPYDDQMIFISFSTMFCFANQTYRRFQMLGETERGDWLSGALFWTLIYQAISSVFLQLI